MDNRHTGVALSSSWMLLFAQSWDPYRSPHPFPLPYILSSPSQWIQGICSPLPVFIIPTFLSFWCLRQGEEIRMFFLPSILAHSYLSKDQSFPHQGPQLPWLPQSRELLAPLLMSPWGRDFGRTIRLWGLVLLRVFMFSPVFLQLWMCL